MAQACWFLGFFDNTSCDGRSCVTIERQVNAQGTERGCLQFHRFFFLFGRWPAVLQKGIYFPEKMGQFKLSTMQHPSTSPLSRTQSNDWSRGFLILCSAARSRK